MSDENEPRTQGGNRTGAKGGRGTSTEDRNRNGKGTRAAHGADARADEGIPNGTQASASRTGEANANGTDDGSASATGGGDGEQPSGPSSGRRSRRFPVLTRDTARPEGGGRVVGAHRPAPYRQWPLLAVCVGVLIGLLVTVAEFRVGTLIIGLSLLGGAALRWAIPSVGMLAVRSRFTDLVLYGVLGLTIVLLALMAQPDPKLRLPFLDTIVHFTVR